MSITYHWSVLQGSDEWHKLRCGLLTASEVCKIITPAKLEVADNDKSREHVFEIAAQQLTKYTEPSYVNDDMLRGIGDEPYAFTEYSNHFEQLKRCGFVTNSTFGFTIGYSPDGLTRENDDGMMEAKSRRQKFQVRTVVDWKIPQENVIQVQTGLLVTQRKWCDYVSYCGGMEMAAIRVYPDEKIQAAIVNAARKFYDSVASVVSKYRERVADPALKLIPTERRIETILGSI